MTYRQEIRLKNGKMLLIRNGTTEDGAAVWENFNLTHGETDYLLSYPDENSFTAEQEADFLQQKTDSKNEVELLAWIDGKLAGTAGIEMIGSKDKVRHRAELGISILRAYWGQGIGTELLRACIECAKKAGYSQLELDVVSENERAAVLYRHFGFVEYGRNPRAFRSRYAGYQELILMRLELEEADSHKP